MDATCTATFNNVRSCLPTMLHWFAWALRPLSCAVHYANTFFSNLRVHSFDMIWIRISDITDHLDLGRSNEPTNPCPEWIHWFIWSTMIQVISDHRSWSGSSQRNITLLLILEINICMKQIRTKILNNPRGELELLFTFTGITYFVHLVHLVRKK